MRVQECDPLRADDNESERYPDIDLGDLALVSVDTGEVRYLAHGWSVRRYRVSPDGRYLATLRILGNDDKHLCIVSLADGGATTLATGVVQSYANAFNWSPDSASLAYVSDGRLYVVALDSSNPREIGVADARLRWPDVSVHVAPRWSADGRTVYALSRGEVWICAADGSRQRRIDGSDIRRRLRLWVQPAEGNELVPFDGESLLMTTLAPGSLHGGLAQMNLVTGTIELIDEWPRHCSHTSMWMEIDRLQDRAYVVMEGAAEPAAVWRFDKKSMRPETFFVPNSRVPPFGDCRLLEWESLSGAPCEGALVLPPGLDEDAGPLPTVVIHADLDDHHSFGYDAYDVGNPHLLAARGYAVLYLDVNVDAGDPMKAQPGQVLPIVRQMVREGIVDSQRIGAYGICYDAYRVMSVLTQSDVYRAAVCASGTYNLTSTYGRIAYWGWSEFGEEELGGSLWDRRDAHIENSPFFYLDRVQAAVLLISGNGDPNVDTQAEDTYRALSRLGRKVSWRSYPGEPTYSNDWSRAHLRDMCNAALDWFDDNL